MENLGLYSYKEVEELNGNADLGCELVDVVEGSLMDNLLFFSEKLKVYRLL